MQTPISAMSRPPSSMSQRAASRISQRPGSRLSHRPPTRSSNRLMQSIQILVTQVTGLTETSGEQYRHSIELVSKAADSVTKQAVGQDLQTNINRLKQLARKHRIQCHDTLSDAIEQSCDSLKTSAELELLDLDQEIKLSKLPDHLQLLLMLSDSPSGLTLQYAEKLLNPQESTSEKNTGPSWNDIIMEEPFTGQHWQGAYGLPDGAVVKSWDDSGSDIDYTPPLSPASHHQFPLQDEDVSQSSEDTADETDPEIESDYDSKSDRNIERSLQLRSQLEVLERRQYWRQFWHSGVDTSRAFDISDPSTLGPTIHRLTTGSLSYIGNEEFINEHDATREVLFALQGRSNLVLATTEDGLDVLPTSSPKLLHISPDAQKSIMSSFASICTDLSRLRVFLQITQPYDGSTWAPVAETRFSTTLEAFSEAVGEQIHSCEAWCAQKEEQMLNPSSQSTLVVSLLQLEQAVRNEFSETFSEVLNILQQLTRNRLSSRDELMKLCSQSTVSPSQFATRLLDNMMRSIQSCNSFGDVVTARFLARIFERSVAPVWGMIHRWLSDPSILVNVFSQRGDPSNVLSKEFFIAYEGLDFENPDFWSRAFVPRVDPEDPNNTTACIPEIFRDISDEILSAGKSLGLLHLLRRTYGFADLDNLQGRPWVHFDELTSKTLRSRGSNSDGNHTIFSPEDLKLIVAEHLKAYCSGSRQTLLDIVTQRLGFWEQLHAVEGLYLMQAGHLAFDVSDAIFARMDAGTDWKDFHFLNTVLFEATEKNPGIIDITRAQLVYRPSSQHSGIAALEGLVVDYAVRLPLNYVFNRQTMRSYNSLFVYLMKIRHAKSCLERMSYRSLHNHLGRASSLKIFFGTKNKLLWFVNSLSSFVCTYVIRCALDSFHAEAKNVKSMEELMTLHQRHLKTLEYRCFLDETTSSIHLAIVKVLDHCHRFSVGLTNIAGHESFNLSHVSITKHRSHRSRRLRKQSRNVISFVGAQPMDNLSDSESSDDDIDESILSSGGADFEGEDTFSESAFVSYHGRLTVELDELVRFIRRSVQSLARGPHGSLFEIFAFSLEDWDL